MDELSEDNNERDFSKKIDLKNKNAGDKNRILKGEGPPNPQSKLCPWVLVIYQLENSLVHHDETTKNTEFYFLSLYVLTLYYGKQLTILKSHFTFHFDLDFQMHFYNCGKSHSSAPLSRLKQMPRIRIICTFTPCLAHNTSRKHQGMEEALRGRQRGDEKTVKRSENSRSLVLMVWIGCSSGRAPVTR